MISTSHAMMSTSAVLQALALDDLRYTRLLALVPTRRGDTALVHRLLRSHLFLGLLVALPLLDARVAPALGSVRGEPAIFEDRARKRAGAVRRVVDDASLSVGVSS